MTNQSGVDIINVNERLFLQDPTSLYNRLLERGPFFNGTHWILSRYAHVSALLKNQAPSKRTGSEPLAGSLRKNILFKDPPDHTRHRSVAQEFFSPKAMIPEEELVTEIVHQLIDQVKNKRQMEFVSEFATRLPVTIMANYLGVSDDKKDELAGYARQFIFEFSNDPEVSDRAVTALRNYFTQHIDNFLRAAIPGRLLARLAAGYRDGIL
ncbi:MAG: hypothetical protein ACK5Q2_06860, partial [Bacteroidota bacterium]